MPKTFEYTKLKCEKCGRSASLQSSFDAGWIADSFGFSITKKEEMDLKKAFEGLCACKK